MYTQAPCGQRATQYIFGLNQTNRFSLLGVSPDCGLTYACFNSYLFGSFRVLICVCLADFWDGPGYPPRFRS